MCFKLYSSVQELWVAGFVQKQKYHVQLIAETILLDMKLPVVIVYVYSGEFFK